MARVAKETARRPLEEEAQPEGVLERVTAATRHVALLAAMVATCGSLYFSQVLGWIPCELCWYQRILMYPLVVILLVGILRDDRGVHLYGLPLALTGMAVSFFHYLEVLQIIPPRPCLGGIPCSADYLTPILTGPWSFVKIPFLALVSFTIVSVMLGNYALAGAPATKARRPANLAAIGIVAATVVVFVGLGLAVRA